MADTLNIEDKLSPELAAVMEEGCRTKPVIFRLAKEAKRAIPGAPTGFTSFGEFQMKWKSAKEQIIDITPAALEAEPALNAESGASASPVTNAEPSGAAPEQGTKPPAAAWVENAEKLIPVFAKVGDVTTTGMKCCPKCGTTKEIETQFGYRMINGKKKPQSYCQPCRGGKRP